MFTLFSFLLSLYRLTEPSNLIFDEEIYVKGFALLKSHHPPLGYLIFGISTKLFGGCPLGWRLPSVLAGTFLIPLVYFLALRLFRSKFIALTSSLLLSFESLTFVHSRLATIDILLTFFVLSSFYFFVELMRKTRKTGAKNAKKYLLFATFFLGLALSTKWSAVFIWMMILILAGIKEHRLILPLFFLPILVYLGIFSICGLNLGEFFSWHRRIFLFHTQTQEGFNLELVSPFWSWHILFSPVTYFRVEKFTPTSHFTQVMNAVGNMPLFWVFLPSFVFLVWEAFRRWKKGKPNFSFLILPFAFFSQWLPWAFSPRPTFLYYFLPAVPFGCIAVAYCLEKAWQRSQLRRFVIGYLSLVIGFFILLYPTFSALPIPEEVFDLVNRLGFIW